MMRCTRACHLGSRLSTIALTRPALGLRCLCLRRRICLRLRLHSFADMFCDIVQDLGRKMFVVHPTQVISRGHIEVFRH
jgi:hypothetical protein